MNEDYETWPKQKIRCTECFGELRPVIEFLKRNGEEAYNEWKKFMLENYEQDVKDSTSWNCLKCGLIYDKDFVKTENKVGWLREIKEHYKVE